MVPDPRFMLRCLDLAKSGLGYVSPNPLVGCVIVHGDRIIGEGYHHGFGESHAEANAIDSVLDKDLLSQACLYVNLEPCSHHGKTPPCADLIISRGIPSVVLGNQDPYPAVNGLGIKKLMNAGIHVITGFMAEECRYLNRRFFTFHEKKRPYIILKWAQSGDGFIAPENYLPEDREKYWITEKTSVQLVHKWRTEEDAILIGHYTVVADNPMLTAREWPGRNPIRFVLDPDHVLDYNHAVFNQKAQTLIYNRELSETIENNEAIKIDSVDFLDGVMQDAIQRGIQSIIIEGGAFTLNNFIARELWDEARVFTGKRVFIKGVPAPRLSFPAHESLTLGNDRLEIWFNRKFYHQGTSAV